MAQTILEEFLAEVWATYFDWYAARIFDGASLANLFQLLVGVVFIYIILMLLSAVIPFVARLLNIIFFPFAIIHAWMHAREMRSIMVTRTPYEAGPHDGMHLMGSGLTLGIFRKEWSGGRLVTDNPRTARRVAFAPLKFFLPLLLLVLLSSPFLVLLIREHRLSVLFHMYLLVGCLWGFPSSDDHYFVWWAIMMRSTFSQWYVLYMVPLFTFTACVNYMMGMPPTEALIQALAYTFVYFELFLLLAIRYAVWQEMDPPELPYWEGLDPFKPEPGQVNQTEFLLTGYDE